MQSLLSIQRTSVFFLSLVFSLFILFDASRQETFDIPSVTKYETYRPIYKLKRLAQEEALNGLYSVRDEEKRKFALSIILHTVFDKLAQGISDLRKFNIEELTNVPIDEAGGVWESTILLADLFETAKVSHIRNLILSNSTRLSLIHTAAKFCSISNFFRAKDQLSFQKMEETLSKHINGEVEYSHISKADFEYLSSLASKIETINAEAEESLDHPKEKIRISELMKERKKMKQLEEKEVLTTETVMLNENAEIL